MTAHGHTVSPGGQDLAPPVRCQAPGAGTPEEPRGKMPFLLLNSARRRGLAGPGMDGSPARILGHQGARGFPRSPRKGWVAGVTLAAWESGNSCPAPRGHGHCHTCRPPAAAGESRCSPRDQLLTPSLLRSFKASAWSRGHSPRSSSPRASAATGTAPARSPHPNRATVTSPSAVRTMPHVRGQLSMDASAWLHRGARRGPRSRPPPGGPELSQALTALALQTQQGGGLTAICLSSPGSCPVSRGCAGWGGRTGMSPPAWPPPALSSTGSHESRVTDGSLCTLQWTASGPGVDRFAS